mgnify:CR=1 FL=1
MALELAAAEKNAVGGVLGHKIELKFGDVGGLEAEKIKAIGDTIGLIIENPLQFALNLIKAVGKGACHPSIMGLSPVPAVKDLMARSGLAIPDFDLVEVNEAFAAQYIGCEKELGLNREITNVNGSGISLGHPVGATGVRIMVTLLHALKKRDKTLGLATLCGGGGVSMACAVEMI